ncbi:hypothetical protein D3C79_927630 [compost metagenome]
MGAGIAGDGVAARLLVQRGNTRSIPPAKSAARLRQITNCQKATIHASTLAAVLRLALGLRARAGYDDLQKYRCLRRCFLFGSANGRRQGFSLS